MKRLWPYIRRYWFLYGIAIASMVVSILLDALSPQITRRLIDQVIVGGETDLLMGLLLGLLGIGLGRAVFQYTKEFIFDFSASGIGCRLRKDLFDHIQTLSVSYFDSHNTGELMARVKDDVDRIWDACGYVGMLSLECIIHTCIIVFCMFRLSPALTLIPLMIMPVIMWLAIKMENGLGNVYDKISEETAEMNTVAQENLAGVRTVKAFAREAYEIRKFKSHNQRFYDLNMEQAKILVRYQPWISFFSRLLSMTVIVAGGIAVIHGKMTIGALGAFLEYANNITWPMEMVGWLSNGFAAAFASNRKIQKIFGQEAEIKNPEGYLLSTEEKAVQTLSGRIQFSHVDFTLHGHMVLKDICFELLPGKTLGIMGVFLFSDSIAENIRTGRKEDTPWESLEYAADCADAHGFIMNLGQRYDTVIGERGVGLSGGQKQRISIARAIAKERPILILDDSTSALDTETEKVIEQRLKELKTSTKIIIGHRISAVRHADEILVLDEGRVIERGTHQELMEQRGQYYLTYQVQYGEEDEGLWQ